MWHFWELHKLCYYLFSILIFFFFGNCIYRKKLTFIIWNIMFMILFQVLVFFIWQFNTHNSYWFIELICCLLLSKIFFFINFRLTLSNFYYMVILNVAKECHACTCIKSSSHIFIAAVICIKFLYFIGIRLLLDQYSLF